MRAEDVLVLGDVQLAWWCEVIVRLRLSFVVAAIWMAGSMATLIVWGWRVFAVAVISYLLSVAVILLDARERAL